MSLPQRQDIPENSIPRLRHEGADFQVIRDEVPRTSEPDIQVCDQASQRPAGEI